MSPHSEFAAMAVTQLRNAQHSDHAFDICERIFEEAMRAERERCAKICDEIAAEYNTKRISAGECNFRDMASEYTIRCLGAAECARKIRCEEIWI